MLKHFLLQIIEMYKKIGLIKQKRRPLTKQERDEVFRLTEEQKRISDQLEAMSVTLNYCSHPIE